MATETLRPNAAGDETNIPFQSPDSTYHWDKVDEATPDEEATFIWMEDTVWKRDFYNIPDHSVGSDTINFIKVYARCKASTTPTQTSLKIAIKSGTGNGAPDTVDEGSEITTTTSWTNYSNQWNTNPATGSAWTWDEIDKLQIGINIRPPGDGKQGCCTQVYVEIDYTPPLGGGSSDITYGTKQQFSAALHEAVYCQVCEIDTNKFVVVSMDNDDSGQARVGTVSGTVITWGAISEFCVDVGRGAQLGVCKLDTDKFVVVYCDDAQNDEGMVRVGTVSGTTISWGTAVEFASTLSYGRPSCCQLGTDKFAVVYDWASQGSVCVCTVSNSTITAGTPVVFEGAIGYPSCCKLDTDKFVAFYNDEDDGYDAKACAFSVSGTTPTAGTIKVIDTNPDPSALVFECCQLDTDKFVIAWQDPTNTKSLIEICTVSGTTITEGAEVELSSVSLRTAGITKLDADEFVVAYSLQADPYYGQSRLCSFSGTTITLGDEETFHAATSDEIKVHLISSGKVVIVYQDDADANDIGEAIIGDIAAGVDVTVEPPAIAVTTAVSVPTLVRDAIFASPLIEVAGAPLVPSLVLDRIFAAPLIEVSAEALVPSVGMATVIIAPLIEVSSQAYAPTFERDTIFSSPLIEVSGEALAPILSLGTTISAPLISVDSAIPAPTLSLGATLLPPVIEVNGEVLVPTLVRDTIFGVPLIVVDSEALVPALSLGITLAAPLIAVDAEAKTPAFSLGVIIAVPLTEISAEGLTPSLALDCIFTSPLIAVTLEALEPAFARGVTITSPLILVDAEALIPLLHIYGRKLKIQVITSQYRLIKPITTQYRSIKAITGR